MAYAGGLVSREDLRKQLVLPAAPQLAALGQTSHSPIYSVLHHHPLSTANTHCAAAPPQPSLHLRLSFYTQRSCSSNSSPAPPLAVPFQVASRAPRLFVQQHPAQLLFSSAYGKDGVTRPRLVWIHCPDNNGKPARKAEMLTELCAEEKDLVIIGGGVAGYVAAIKAGQEGLKVRSKD